MGSILIEDSHIGKRSVYSDFGQCLDELRNMQIIIYGAGKIGKRVSRSFARFGIPVRFFWDAKADLIRRIGALQVLKPDFEQIDREERDHYVVIVTVFSENVSRLIKGNLVAEGFHNTIADKDYINSLLRFDCQTAIDNKDFNFDLKTCHVCPVSKEMKKGCRIFDDYIRNHFLVGTPHHAEPEAIIIPSIGLLVSNKCTLTCKGCNHLREYYKPSDNIVIEPDQLIDDMNNLIAAVDLIQTIKIVGGEPFLYRHIGQVIKSVLKLPKIGIVHIITNGTVVRDEDDLYNLLSNERIIVEISGYGDNIPKILRGNVDKFITKLNENNVNYIHTQTMQWFDFGEFNDRSYSKAELLDTYSSCCFISNDIFDGTLYKCSRSAYGTYLGKIPRFNQDYVKVRNTSKEQLRKQFIKFFNKKYVEVCRYCNGTSTATIDVGKQVRSGELIN